MFSENLLLSAPVSTLTELNNLFIELTEKNCNQHCKHCYIDFPINKKVKDFISLDKIKDTLAQTKDEPLNCIYLTGAEPMTHPDFNNILRLCLTRTNVCICTNGSYINEKKARFLKKVEDESEYSIIFQLPLDHYNEVKCDDIRSRGSYRQVIHAIKYLNKYDFYLSICVTNYYKESKQTLIGEFKKVFESFGIEVDLNCIKINEYYDKNNTIDEITSKNCTLDCENSRILTEKGIYACPFLANDYRGRMGSDLSDYAKKILLETAYCATCLKNPKQMFALDKELFD